ncbi:MAG: mechanosensitive ion channel family protein [Thermoanaerobaculia bacterium]
MTELLTELRQLFTVEFAVELLQAGVYLVIGFLIAWAVSALLGRVLRLRLEPVRTRLLRRIAFYGILLLFVAAVLSDFGLRVGTILLGTGGLLAVAVGFASQTSFSNLISGLFLIGERPFDVGDVITVGATTGEVLSIDLLSVKLRTFDNLFVRIPNENLLKSEVRTLTRFPIRRADVNVGVSYMEDLKQVREVLEEVARRNPLCLEEPVPQIFLTGFGSSSIDLQYSIWATRENYVTLKNQIQEEIKAAFDAHGIEIPFPHLTVAGGKATRPLPVETRGEK